MPPQSTTRAPAKNTVCSCPPRGRLPRAGRPRPRSDPMRSRAAGAARHRRELPLHTRSGARTARAGRRRPVRAARRGPLGVTPGFRNREGHDEQRRHRHGHGGTHDAGVGPGLVAKPGVRGPSPPQQREDEQVLEYPQRDDHLDTLTQGVKVSRCLL